MEPLKIFIVAAISFMVCLDTYSQSAIDSIRSYDTNEDFERGFIMIEKYESLYTSENKYDSLAVVLYEKMNFTSSYRNIAILESELDKSITILSKHLPPTNKHLLYINNKKANYLGQIGKLIESENLFNTIISTTQSDPNNLIGVRLKAESDLSFLNLRKGNPQMAIEIASKIKEEILEHKDTTDILNTLRVLSIGNLWMTEYEEALKYSLEALPIAVSHLGEHHGGTGMIVEQLASVYSSLGKIPLAIKYYNQTHEIDYNTYKQTGNGSNLAVSLGNIGQFYSNLGEYDLAIDYLNKGYALNTEVYGKNSFKNNWYLNQLKTIHRMYGDMNQASKYLKELKALHDKNESLVYPYDKASLIFSEAEILYEKDLNQEAEPLALKAYHFFENNPEIGDPKDRMKTLNLLTNIFIDNKEVDKAKYWGDINLKWHNENFHVLSSLRLDALQSQLQLHRITKDTAAANKLYKDVMTLRHNGSGDTTLTNIIPDSGILIFCAYWVKYLLETSETDKSYTAKYYSFLEEFEVYYDIHLSTIKTSSAIAANEKYLKEIYAPAIILLLDDHPIESFQKSETISSFGIRQVLQQRIIETGTLPNIDDVEGDDDDIFLNIAYHLDSLQQFRDSLLTYDSITYKKYFGMRKSEINTYRELIDHDELMINMVILDDKVILYYLSKDTISTMVHDLSEMTVLLDKVIVHNDTSALEKLGNILVSSSLANEYKKLLITPDAIFTNLNWEQLTDNGKPFLYTKTIRYALSPTILRYQNELAENQDDNTQLMGITPGFSESLKQNATLTAEGDTSFQYLLQQPFLISLSDYLQQEYNGKTFKNDQATENAFYENHKDYKILHIGTHGILNNDSPLFSKLIFAKDSLEDGYMHAYEIYGQNLNSGLAVLSACSSGKDKQYANQGVVSLSRAFTHAGCPAILMSLWDVDEKSTSEILKLFYKNLKKGDTKSQALRDAKIEFLEASPVEYQKPYYWAGLVVIGSDVPLYATSLWSSNKIYILLIALIAILLLVFFIRREK